MSMNVSANRLQAESCSQKDPRKLTNLNEILSCLSWYQSEEAALSNSLAGLLSDRASVAGSLRQLEALFPHLDDLYLETSQLAGRVSATARTADRVGGRVRTLDREMSRVAQAAERVGQVIELKVIPVHVISSDDFPGLHLSSPPFHNCNLALNVKTGNQRQGIVPALCRCPLKLFLVPLQKPLWYTLSCDPWYTLLRFYASRPQKIISLLYKHFKPPGNNSCRYSLTNLHRHHDLAMQPRQAATSNCFQ